MPVVAVVGGERVEAWTFDATSWETLKRGYRSTGLVMSCGQPGIPVTSPRGLRFFRHEAGAECQLHDGGDETAEHFSAKATVAETARSLGWAATVERRSDDGSWIADVLLEHPAVPRPVAVEIQWSRQSNADFHRRQDRYTAAGVDCFWIVGPTNKRNVVGVPSYAMAGEPGALTLTTTQDLGGRPQSNPLADAIALLLRSSDHQPGDRILPYAELTSTSLAVDVIRVNCWNEKCGRPMSRWRLSHVATESRCGQHPSVARGLNLPTPDPAIADVVTAALAASDLATPAGHDPARPAMQLCPYCKIAQGNGLLGYGDWHTYTIPFIARPRFRIELLTAQHRCTDIGRGYCRPPEPGGSFPASSDYVLGPAKEPGSPLPPKKPRRGPEPPWKTPAQRKREAAAQQAIREKREAEKRAARALKVQEAVVARLASLERAWPDHPLRAYALEKHGGTWPRHLDYEPKSGFEVPHQMWQTELYYEFIHDQRHDTAVDPRELGYHLQQIFPDIKDPNGAIVEWLYRLAEARIVSATPRSEFAPRFFHVINLEELRAQAERNAAEQARRKAEEAARPPAPPPPVNLRCKFCGHKLDPVYADQGYHTVCAPGWRYGSTRH
ncbi:hypothetical protein [Leifsonia sp. fls2-241-R2A-40a]|uniref:competence protein CoiA family protein n=1 Tax=Leifsonia sp. fls2-241-R2A-40a TaxID=3040290 RepID=UPI00254BFD84|nr:hypothetical protein [Leifsonia sp. fls2-241-R2A-40a]